MKKLILTPVLALAMLAGAPIAFAGDPLPGERALNVWKQIAAVINGLRAGGAVDGAPAAGRRLAERSAGMIAAILSSRRKGLLEIEDELSHLTRAVKIRYTKLVRRRFLAVASGKLRPSSPAPPSRLPELPVRRFLAPAATSSATALHLFVLAETAHLQLDGLSAADRRVLDATAQAINHVVAGLSRRGAGGGVFLQLNQLLLGKLRLLHAGGASSRVVHLAEGVHDQAILALSLESVATERSWGLLGQLVHYQRRMMNDMVVLEHRAILEIETLVRQHLVPSRAQAVVAAIEAAEKTHDRLVHEVLRHLHGLEVEATRIHRVVNGS